jgi:hypothetical protein
MFAVVPDPIPARMRVLNRADVCDANFLDAVRGWRGTPRPRPAPDAPILPGSTLTAAAFGELFDSQLASRQLDLMARVLRVQNKVFYTIGSSGHEGNALLARACRHTDPAFLHYRSGAFMAERSRQVPGIDPLRDAALSFAASADDPASGGRTRCGAASRCGCCRRPRPSPRICPRRWAPRWPSRAASGWATRCRFRPTASCCARSAMPRPTMPPRRPRSTPRCGRPTRSCRRRSCSSARTTAWASR